MKNFKKLLVVGLAGLTLQLQAATFGLPTPINSFSAGSTNGHGTLSHAIITARSGNGGAPAIKYINAGSDKVGATVRFSKVTSQMAATHTNSTTTLFVNSTNTGVNWLAGTVVIRHLVNDVYEKRVLANNSAQTNIILTVAPLQEVVPGDIIYYCVTNTPTIIWGPAASTNSLNAAGAPIYVGQAGYPLIVEIDATTAGVMSLVSGDFVEPQRTPRPGL